MLQGEVCAEVTNAITTYNASCWVKYKLKIQIQIKSRMLCIDGQIKQIFSVLIL